MHYLHRQLPKTSLIKVRMGGGGEEGGVERKDQFWLSIRQRLQEILLVTLYKY